MKKSLVVWLISDEVPGHVTQSRGLLQLLTKTYQTESHELATRLRLKLITRPILGFLLKYCRKLWPMRMAAALHKTTRLPDSEPDVIISMGGNTSFLNVALSRIHHCKNIFIGSLRQLNASCFSAVLTLEPVGAKNNIVMNFAPTEISPEKATLAANEYNLEKKLDVANLWAMIIGGNGAGFKYTLEDWRNLSEGMIALADRYGIKWLLSTSRRTGLKGEDQLRQLLPETILADAVWYNHRPQKVMLPFLGLADRVFVTADSMSMISETIHAGKVVQILIPQIARPNLRYRNALSQFESRGFASRIDLNDLGHSSFSENPGQITIDEIQKDLLNRLTTVLDG